MVPGTQYGFIHVTAPSFVRGLSNFRIAENHRPGDEDLPTDAIHHRCLRATHVMGTDIGKEHCFELALDTIQFLKSIKQIT